jgi:DNA uptake protein ComE-like DNA-binding protein
VSRRIRLVCAAVGVALLPLLMPGLAEAQAGRRGDVLDVNTASEKQVASVPGMTPDLVRSVLARRPFLAATELDAALAPLTPAQRAEVYRRLFVQVNVNAAPDEELQLVPGMTAPAIAAVKNGRPHKTLVQFRNHVGAAIGAQAAEALDPFVFVPINLNTASDADIMSIPRMGQRMLREFKEYRPYKALAQFRREIGKYVDAKEVARLERYVSLD